MRACVQRVNRCTVMVEGKQVGQIGSGLAVLLGVTHDDTSRDAEYLADKITQLRVFNDDHGKMNRSLLDVRGEILVISQFTLMGDCRRGRRPSYIDAAEPGHAETLYEHFIRHVRRIGVATATGQFRAMMSVHLVNDGPVTLLLDSKKRF